THENEGRDHLFTIEDVVRTEDASSVAIVASGDPIGVTRDDETGVESPALGDFKLMKTHVVQHPGQVVVRQLSDPLTEDQSLRGVGRIPDLPDLDYDIRDNEIWIYPPSRLAGTKSIYIEPGVRNILDDAMKNQTVAELVFEQLKPEVRFTGRGNIL